MVQHLSDSTEIHLQYANKKIQEQSNHMKLLSQQFDELETYSKDTIGRLESKLQRLEYQLTVNSQKLEESQQRNGRFSGILIWEVPNFHKKFQGVKKGNNTFSKYMFALEGYKLKLELLLNGHGESRGNYVSTYTSTVPGPFDDTLEWPMKAEITFSVIKGEEEIIRDCFQTDDTRESLTSFKKPPHDHGGWGESEFIDHTEIQNYIFDNKLTLKVTVK